MKAIYKIENKINHKIYIGQSKNPERRFKNHCNKKESLIGKAIQKYGKENFSFEVLGWFEDYNKKEKEFIVEYHSLVPYGYNVTKGGEETPVLSGENNPMAKISKEVADAIKKDLKNFSIPRKQIVKKHKVTHDIVRHINEGDYWKDENETYPLRPVEKCLNDMRVQQIIEMLILTDIPMNQIGAKVGWGRSSTKEINAGRNHFNEKFRYPLRNNKEYNKTLLNL